MIQDIERNFLSLLTLIFGDSLAAKIHWFTWNKYYALYTIVAIAFVEYALRKQQVMKPKDDKDRERDVKYSAFRKSDAFLGDSIMWRLVLYLMTPLIPIRFLIGWGAACMMAILLRLAVLVFGGDRPDRYNKAQR